MYLFSPYKYELEECHKKVLWPLKWENPKIRAITICDFFMALIIEKFQNQGHSAIM